MECGDGEGEERDGVEGDQEMTSVPHLNPANETGSCLQNGGDGINYGMIKHKQII